MENGYDNRISLSNVSPFRKIYLWVAMLFLFILTNVFHWLAFYLTYIGYTTGKTVETNPLYAKYMNNGNFLYPFVSQFIAVDIVPVILIVTLVMIVWKLKTQRITPYVVFILSLFIFTLLIEGVVLTFLDFSHDFGVWVQTGGSI